MNWASKVKRNKRVNISFEYADKYDLRLILNDLINLISSGIETHHSEIKSLQIEDKWHEVEFQQEYVDKIHESTESDINGELKLVIKSNF